jgi:hypothetical protein
MGERERDFLNTFHLLRNYVSLSLHMGSLYIGGGMGETPFN